MPEPSDVDALAAKLAAEIRKGAPSPTAAPTRESILKRLDDAGKEGAGKFAEALAETVLMPAQMQNVRHAAQLNRRVAEGSATIGPLYKRFKDAVEARATELGGDAYIAEKGLEGVIRAVAAEDPAYTEEVVESRLQARIAAIEAEKAKKQAEAAASAAAAAGARPPTETVHAGAAPAPASAAPSEADEIARIAISDEDAKLGRAIFRMTPGEIRVQRHQIAKMEAKYGVIGIKQLGGVPICELRDCVVDTNGRPYPAEED
jgi:hypothetical protein